MTFTPREKEKESGPILKRDDNGILDQSDAAKQADQLMEKLITTQRDFQRDNTFKNVKTNRRDIVVKTIIYQKNTVNGRLVKDDYQNPLFEKLGDEPLDPIRYNLIDYIDGEISVREMPMSATTVTRWSMGMYRAVINYLARMNVMDRI